MSDRHAAIMAALARAERELHTAVFAWGEANGVSRDALNSRGTVRSTTGRTDGVAWAGKAYSYEGVVRRTVIVARPLDAIHVIVLLPEGDPEHVSLADEIRACSVGIAELQSVDHPTH